MYTNMQKNTYVWKCEWNSIKGKDNNNSCILGFIRTLDPWIKLIKFNLDINSMINSFNFYLNKQKYLKSKIYRCI